MFTFTLLTSLLFALLAVLAGIYSYMAFKSDDGSQEGWIGTIAGAVFGGAALACGVIGAIGFVILANRVWQ